MHIEPLGLLFDEGTGYLVSLLLPYDQAPQSNVHTKLIRFLVN